VILPGATFFGNLLHTYELKYKNVFTEPHITLQNVWQDPFLTKIQNRISEKTRKKIVLLSFKIFVKTQFLGVVEFPSIF
jgi:hypothetical protein